MNKDFLNHIYQKHKDTEAVPASEEIAFWATRLIKLLFPEQEKDFFPTTDEIEGEIWNLGNELKNILNATDQCQDCDNEDRAKQFVAKIPELFRVLNTDIKAILDGDPAAKTEFEVIRAYPGFMAICYYRIAHILFNLDIPVIPRILTEHGHSKTGIDIHPGAIIGENFFIDHGTGIVIGETTIIGKNVKLYQGITLGALSVSKDMANKKRHPTIKDNVIIYSGATILGGETIIGENSIIGGNVWLTGSIPANSLATNKAEVKIKDRE